MATPTKIVSGLHANWLISLIGLFLSYAGSIILVRSIPPESFAQYASVLAIAGVATLLFEAGANSGLTRYLHDAERRRARGTFYLQMLKRRWIAALLCGIALIICGPLYARAAHLGDSGSELGTPHAWLFPAIALFVATSLTRLLPHYGLLAVFEVKATLLLQQFFVVARSLLLAAVGLTGGGLGALVAVLIGTGLLEAVVIHRKFWNVVKGEREPLDRNFTNQAQTFGLFTILDKASAMLGSGTVILLVLAPRHPAAIIAALGVAIDLVGKIVSLTVMPMGNLVAPYLSVKGSDPQEQATAITRILKLSSLLYSFSIGAGFLLLPRFIPAIYGDHYKGATTLALLLLLPTAFENWIRGYCSPALLRNGRAGTLLKLNILQAAATVLTFTLVCQHPINSVILAVGGVRAAIAVLGLFALRTLAPARSYLVPIYSVGVAVVSCWVSSKWGALLPWNAAAQGVLEFAIYCAVSYAGVRWFILRDPDTLRLARRITEGRARSLAWLLPSRPPMSA